MIVLTRQAYLRVLEALSPEETKLVESNLHTNCSGYHYISNLPDDLERKINQIRDSS